jgi:hypothetical protein
MSIWTPWKCRTSKPIRTNRKAAPNWAAFLLPAQQRTNRTPPRHKPGRRPVVHLVRSITSWAADTQANLPPGQGGQTMWLPIGKQPIGNLVGPRSEGFVLFGYNSAQTHPSSCARLPSAPGQSFAPISPAFHRANWLCTGTIRSVMTGSLVARHQSSIALPCAPGKRTAATSPTPSGDWVGRCRDKSQPET